MGKERSAFEYELFRSAAELSASDRRLLEVAQDASSRAYAPYSKFKVGAAAELVSGEVITGVNVENASYPAGLCAEASAIANASTLYPGVAVKTLAISYQTEAGNSDHPVAPCGICRQRLQELRERTGTPIRLVMGGESGNVVVVEDASDLLPFSFRF